MPALSDPRKRAVQTSVGLYPPWLVVRQPTRAKSDCMGGRLSQSDCMGGRLSTSSLSVRLYRRSSLVVSLSQIVWEVVPYKKRGMPARLSVCKSRSPASVARRLTMH
jgi:hypothetical protein